MCDTLECVFACLHDVIPLCDQKPLKCMVTLCEACVEAVQVTHHTTTLFIASLAHETIVCICIGLYDCSGIFSDSHIASSNTAILH